MMKTRLLSIFVALLMVMGTFLSAPLAAGAVSTADVSATTTASATDITTASGTAATTQPTATAPGRALADRTVIRLNGSDRYETAVALAKNGWNSAENAVVASGESFADALAGVPLAHALDAPILLTDGKTVSSALSGELARLDVKNVYILGGVSAVSAAVESTLSGTYKVERIAGISRYETSASIARRLMTLKGQPARVFIASGESYPDALAGSTAAAMLSQPILFAPQNGTVDAAVSRYLSDAGLPGANLLGGSSVLSDAIKNALSSIGISDTQRIYGADRYETALNVYKTYSWLFSGNGAAVATGDSFPDALSGGALCAKQGIPLLLLNNRTTVSGAYDALSARPDDRLYVFGGTGALTDYTVNCLRTNTPMLYIPPAPVTPPSTPSTTGGTVTIIGDFCNVRTGPGSGYTLLGKVYKNSSYKLYGTKTAANGVEWYEIDYNGKRGFICASYASAAPASSGSGKNNAYILNPNYKSNYYIVVYVGSQSVVVYGKDANGKYNKEVRKMKCSSGLPDTPTPLGLYALRTKYRWQLMLGDVYTQYASGFAKNYLFHSVLYQKPDPSTLFPNSYRNLGKRASHGCVRLCTRDCKWIYDNCPIGTQVRIVSAKGPAGSPIPALKTGSKYYGWDPSDPSSKNPYNK